MGTHEARVRPPGRRRERWFANYVSSTLARDLLELADVRRLDDVERLLRLLATQSANLLSYRKVGARLDMHHATVRAYVVLLEQMFLVKRLPAWRPGLGAREATTPKLYVCDSGLLAHLLGADVERIEDDDQITGKLCETFVAGELLRHASWSEQQPRLYHYQRDREDVDLVLENNRGRDRRRRGQGRRDASRRRLEVAHEARGRSRRRFRPAIVVYAGEQTIPLGRNGSGPSRTAACGRSRGPLPCVTVALAYGKYAAQKRPTSDCRRRVSTPGHKKSRCFQRLPESPLPDSNRRPLPYHGSALPAELRGRGDGG